MRKQFITACLYTLVTTVLLGLGYPLAVTVLAHFLMPAKANGQLIAKDGVVVGSKLIGQPFTGPGYFNGRPSAAGTGYDAANSSGSNLGPTNATLIARVDQSVQSWQTREAKHGNARANVPIDLVTTSGSGLDPDITVAAAEYQVASVAQVRGLPKDRVAQLVKAHIEPRQFGVLGEPRVNVLELNLALDDMAAQRK
ncbi:MAG: potassium-transporting ATPase subunit KdpC [Acidobacteriaceae bacterium]